MLTGKIKISVLSAIFVVLMITALSPAGFQSPVQAEVMLEQESRTNMIAEISAQTAEAVVLVSTERDISFTERHPFHDDPIFRFFFPEYFRDDERGKREDIRRGSGTGFIVDEDGYIVTNQHVIAGSDRIFVTMRGEENGLEAEVVWADSSLDLAVLKIDEPDNLTAVQLGNSDNIHQGDWAIAIGNPYGFEHTVTVGVVSALGRPIEVPTERGQIRHYSNLIQTDAAINPGNSGGPLLNIEGEVIGINTAVATRAQGIGFAIPINEVKFALEEIKEFGRVAQPWLGVYYREVTSEIREHFDLKTSSGVIVMDVIADSPAEKAGIQPYDIIREINRQEIISGEKFAEIIGSSREGERLMLRIIRDGTARILFATIEQRPADY